MKNEGFEKYINENCVKEFNYIKQITDNDPSHKERLIEYNNLCRYSDIRTYKDNSVEIQSKNGYINASWINLPSQRFFIATQGPMKSTIEDFWEMCFKYDVKIIIMLCKLVENNKEKCANYWEQVKDYQIVRIKEDIILMPGLIVRQFNVQNLINKASKTILQFQLETWDDHSAPIENYDKIITLIDLIDKNKTNSPIVVHCSAGIGRTGTFISMYNLYHEILAQIKDIKTQEITFSIMNLVRQLKEMRLYLVENENQYILLYQFVYLLLKQIN